MMKFDRIKVKTILVQKEMKERDAAKKLRTSPVYFCQLLQGDRQPSIKLVNKMSKFFGIPAKDLYVEV